MIDSDTTPLLNGEELETKSPCFLVPALGIPHTSAPFRARINNNETYTLTSAVLVCQDRPIVRARSCVKDKGLMFMVGYIQLGLRRRKNGKTWILSPGRSITATVRELIDGSLSAPNISPYMNYAVLFTAPVLRPMFAMKPIRNPKAMVENCNGHVLVLLEEGSDGWLEEIRTYLYIERVEGDEPPKSINAHLYKKKGSYFVPVVDEDSNFITLELKCMWKRC